jgi:L-asparaginase II
VLDVDPVLAEVVRSGVVESVHRGRLVALRADGAVARSVGAVGEPVLLRSCAKPLQAVAMLRLGLDLDGAELAVACASHDGTPAHVAIVRRVLAGVGLDEAALGNAELLPLEPRAAAERVLAGGPDRLHHNCSGKHAAMVATCVVNGWSIDDYLGPAHPLQVGILATVEDLAGEAPTTVAVDGCGAPIAALTVGALARAFARLATAPAGTAEHRVAGAMRAHAEVVGGERRDVTRLMRAVTGLLAKDGAEGCYAAAGADGRAVAFKVADGSGRARAPIMVAALRALGFDQPGLTDLAEVPVLGGGRPVGLVRAAPEPGP